MAKRKTADQIAALYPELDSLGCVFSLRIKQKQGDWVVLEDNLKHSVARVLYSSKRGKNFNGDPWHIGMFEKETLIVESGL